jgi:deazaflavin-dependent oxidoreductase (nitroreductase family)
MSDMSDWNDKVMAEFRENDGTVERFGRNLVIMHTLGAKSGEQRPSPVMGIPQDGSWLVAATAAGAENDPAWAHNLRANPDIDLEVATDDGIAIVPVHTEEQPEPARSTDWEKFKAASPGFASYEEKTERKFPIFKFSPR